MHVEAILESNGLVVAADIDDNPLQAMAAALDPVQRERFLYYGMDVSDESSIRSVRNNLFDKGIRVSVLINNAARNPTVGGKGLQSSGRLENLDLGSLMADINVGLIGSLLCAKVFGEDMAAKGAGVIINVASDLGIIAPDQRLYRKEGVPDLEQDVKPVSYSLVKHGLIGLTRYLATYWADRGVRCNSISPGGVFNGQNEEFVKRVSNLIPMGRMAEKNEYQGAILFLASAASSYMNGANLVVDGGRSVW
jgi:NAD(P)-dependent dehydrogenase (short-subunit alcohol dehydrogenase family)